MKALHKGLFLVPVIVAFASAPALAQSWKWDWGINAGYAWYSSALDEDDTGLPDEAGGAEVHWKKGFIYGTQLTFNIKPKLGLRLNGRYADRPLVGADIENGSTFATSTNLWTATADLLFRFKEPAPEFTKMEMLPYLALGLGAKWHNGSEDVFTCTDATNSYNCNPFVTGLPSMPRGFAFGEENAIAGLIGLGADWRLGRRIALRTEINDVIYKPQFHTATRPATGTVWAVSEENVASMVHELGIQVGLHFLFGLAAPPVVAVAPPPPPPPPAAPPAAPPAPRRESISVCVIDPAAPGGVRMQTATLIESRDTVVVVSGTDRPFRETVGTVTVAAGSDWYVQGRPLTLTVGTAKTEFATYGTPRMIEATDLAYVGTVNGFPVYADKDDVNDVIGELNDLNRAKAGTDLGVILGEQKDLRTAFSNVKVLYVPMSATGCVFQAVQRQEEVRKGGK
jgi:hypothetical protein